MSHRTFNAEQLVRFSAEKATVTELAITGHASIAVWGVRAGQEVFTAEIEAAGFKQIEQQDLLKDNYVVRFRKIRK